MTHGCWQCPETPFFFFFFFQSHVASQDWAKSTMFRVSPVSPTCAVGGLVGHGVPLEQGLRISPWFMGCKPFVSPHQGVQGGYGYGPWVPRERSPQVSRAPRAMVAVPQTAPSETGTRPSLGARLMSDGFLNCSP